MNQNYDMNFVNDLTGFFSIEINRWHMTIKSLDYHFIMDDRFMYLLTDKYINWIGVSPNGNIIVIKNGENAPTNLAYEIMKDDINKYIDRTGDVNPEVLFLDTLKSNLSYNNMKVISRDDKRIIHYGDPTGNYIGVFKAESSYGIKVKDLETLEPIKLYFKLELEAAMTYDYYMVKLYPNKIGLTNFEHKKYNQSILDAYKIKTKFDIKPFEPLPPKNKTGINKNIFTGIHRYKNRLYPSVMDPELGKRKFVSESGFTLDKLMDCVACRVEYMMNHVTTSIPNYIPIDEEKSKGKIICALQLITKEETKDYINTNEYIAKQKAKLAELSKLSEKK